MHYNGKHWTEMKEYNYMSMSYEHLHITTWSYQWFKASVIENYKMLSCKIHSFIAILNLRHEGY